MDNSHLFELLNAGPGLDALHLNIALFLARWATDLVALALGIAWVRADGAGRAELLRMVLAALAALVIAQGIEFVWPQPRPVSVHQGTQYFEPWSDASLPSDHVTGLWALALGALRTRRYGTAAFPLLTVGLLVGLSHVYLGVHFPYDIAAALPVAALGALLEHHAAARTARWRAAWLARYERLQSRALRSRDPLDGH